MNLKTETKLTAPGNAIHIPAPTEEDLQWALSFSANDHYDFYESCKAENLWRIQFALNNGVNVHVDTDEPLHSSCRNNCLKSVRLLHANGANLDACNGLALRMAAEYKYGALAELLLQLGAKGELALEECHDSQEKLFLQKIMYEKPQWFVSDETTIHKVEYQILGSDIRKLTTSFNFAARRIMFTIEQNKMMTSPSTERFSEQDTTQEIEEAYARLQENGAKLAPLSDYTGKVCKPSVRTMQPRPLGSASA